MDDKEWLKNLKTGDEVAVDSAMYGAGSVWSIYKVSHTTATQIHVAMRNSVTKYRRESGREIGGDTYHSTEIVPVTDEIRAGIKRHKLLASLRAVKWETLTTAHLESVVEIVKQAEAERKEKEDAG